VEKSTLFEHMDAVLLIIDELVDNGYASPMTLALTPSIILETDPVILSKAAQTSVCFPLYH